MVGANANAGRCAPHAAKPVQDFARLRAAADCGDAMNMHIMMPSDDVALLVADYDGRMVAAEQYADQCAAILVAEHGADATKLDRSVFTSHHFSRWLDGKAPRTPAEQVAACLNTGRPEVLGLVVTP